MFVFFICLTLLPGSLGDCPDNADNCSITTPLTTTTTTATTQTPTQTTTQKTTQKTTPSPPILFNNSVWNFVGDVWPDYQFCEGYLPDNYQNISTFNYSFHALDASIKNKYDLDTNENNYARFSLNTTNQPMNETICAEICTALDGGGFLFWETYCYCYSYKWANLRSTSNGLFTNTGGDEIFYSLKNSSIFRTPIPYTPTNVSVNGFTWNFVGSVFPQVQFNSTYSPKNYHNISAFEQSSVNILFETKNDSTRVGFESASMKITSCATICKDLNAGGFDFYLGYCNPGCYCYSNIWANLNSIPHHDIGSGNPLANVVNESQSNFYSLASFSSTTPSTTPSTSQTTTPSTSQTTTPSTSQTTTPSTTPPTTPSTSQTTTPSTTSSPSAPSPPSSPGQSAVVNNDEDIAISTAAIIAFSVGGALVLGAVAFFIYNSLAKTNYETMRLV